MSGIPFDIDAEKGILAAVMMRPERILEQAPDLSGKDFYNPVYGRVWDSFREMWDKEGLRTIDAVVLADAVDNAVTPADLVVIMAEGVVAQRTHVEIVLKHSAARNIMERMKEGLGNLSEGGDPYEEMNDLDKFFSSVGSLSGTQQESVTLWEMADNAEALAPVVIPTMMHQDYRTIIVAEEGTGKSLILRTIAQAAAQGRHPFSHLPFKPVRALVVDLENPAQAILQTGEILERRLMLAAGEQYDPERLRFFRRPGGMNIRNLQDKADLQREIAYHRPELVCIGPIYKMYRRTSGESYEDSADEAMAVLDELRTKYEFALVMEHHAAKGKSGETRDLSPMGSQRWMAWPEIGISLYKDKNDPTTLNVRRYRGDRLTGVAWPDRIVRNNSGWLVDGVWDNGYPTWEQ